MSRRVPGFAGFATNLYDPVQVPLPGSTLVVGDLADPSPIARSRLRSPFASGTLSYVFAAGSPPVTLRLTVDNVAYVRYRASAFDVFSAASLQGQPRTVKASVSAKSASAPVRTGAPSRTSAASGTDEDANTGPSSANFRAGRPFTNEPEEVK